MPIALDVRIYLILFGGRFRNSMRDAGINAAAASEKRASAAIDAGNGSVPLCRNLTTGKLVPNTAATNSASRRGHSGGGGGAGGVAFSGDEDETELGDEEGFAIGGEVELESTSAFAILRLDRSEGAVEGADWFPVLGDHGARGFDGGRGGCGGGGGGEGIDVAARTVVRNTLPRHSCICRRRCTGRSSGDDEIKVELIMLNTGEETNAVSESISKCSPFILTSPTHEIIECLLPNTVS